MRSSRSSITSPAASPSTMCRSMRSFDEAERSEPAGMWPPASRHSCSVQGSVFRSFSCLRWGVSFANADGSPGLFGAASGLGLRIRALQRQRCASSLPQGRSAGLTPASASPSCAAPRPDLSRNARPPDRERRRTRCRTGTRLRRPPKRAAEVRLSARSRALADHGLERPEGAVGREQKLFGSRAHPRRADRRIELSRVRPRARSTALVGAPAPPREPR